MKNFTTLRTRALLGAALTLSLMLALTVAGSSPADAAQTETTPTCPADYTLDGVECVNTVDPVVTQACPDTAVGDASNCSTVVDGTIEQECELSSPVDGFCEVFSEAIKGCPDGYTEEAFGGEPCSKSEDATQGAETCPTGALGEPDACYIVTDALADGSCDENSIKDEAGVCRQAVANAAGEYTCAESSQLNGTLCTVSSPIVLRCSAGELEGTDCVVRTAATETLTCSGDAVLDTAGERCLVAVDAIDTTGCASSTATLVDDKCVTRIAATCITGVLSTTGCRPAAATNANALESPKITAPAATSTPIPTPSAPAAAASTDTTAQTQDQPSLAFTGSSTDAVAAVGVVLLATGATLLTVARRRD